MLFFFFSFNLGYCQSVAILFSKSLYKHLNIFSLFSYKV